MRVYIIGNDGITLCREAPATVNDGKVAVASKAELHAATTEYNGRAKCINLGHCTPGCAQGAKASVDITYWPHALRARVELRTNGYCAGRELFLRHITEYAPVPAPMIEGTKSAQFDEVCHQSQRERRCRVASAQLVGARPAAIVAESRHREVGSWGDRLWPLSHQPPAAASCRLPVPPACSRSPRRRPSPRRPRKS